MTLVIEIMNFVLMFFSTGKLVRTIKIPAETVTGAIYGGENLDTLFVTSSVRKSSFDGQKHADSNNPESGKIFIINGLSSKGSAVLSVSMWYRCIVSQLLLNVVLLGMRKRF